MGFARYFLRLSGPVVVVTIRGIVPKQRVCKHQQANIGRPVLQQLWGIVNSDQSCPFVEIASSFYSLRGDFRSVLWLPRWGGPRMPFALGVHAAL